jgi:murein L,D-transpeptidase YcbB/YkuD
MKVVVGKRGSRTPIFRDTLTHVVLNPYWNVPPGIAARELRPNGSAYLAARGYETVAGGGLRQRPGPGNSLGRVKFVLDNQQLIYLHDTPEKHLFGRSERAFSHGCIRLERPLELAEWALRDHPEWSPERLRAAVARGRHDSWIPLPREIPVYVLYFTTWAEDDGRVHFRRDLYGFDESLAQALERRSPEPSRSLLAAGS